MTVENIETQASLVGDDVSTTISFSSNVTGVLADDIAVYKRNDSDGTTTLLFAGLDYTLGDNHAFVTLTSPSVTGFTYLMTLKPAPTQETDLPNASDLRSQTIEDTFDRIAHQLQWLQHQLDRCIKLNFNSTAFGLELDGNAANRVDQTIIFDANGDPVVGSALIDVFAAQTAVSAFIETLLDDIDGGEARTTLGAAEAAITPAYSAATGQITVNDNTYDLGTPGGWCPYAFQPGFSPTFTTTTALNLAANGGTVAIPIVVPAHMLLDSIDIWQTDSANAHTAEWRLYREGDTSGPANEAEAVTGADGTFSFTPGAANKRNSAASGVPVYLNPGLYWLVIRNTHATNTFGLGSLVAGTLAMNTAQTKTIALALDTTLDLITSWSKTTAAYAAILKGHVFRQSAVF